MIKLLCLCDCYVETRYGLKKLHSEGEIYEGKIYEGEIYDPNNEIYYWIISKLDSKGISEGFCFSKEKFIPLSEYREQQMLSVLNG